jgi:hypothetical protein
MMTVKFGTLELEVTTNGRTTSMAATQLVRGSKVSIASHGDTKDAKTALKAILAFIS